LKEQTQIERNLRLGVRVSKEERLEVAEQAEISHLTVSEYIRRRVLGKRVVSKADLAVLAELRRLGGLLKHVHNESRGAYHDLTAQAIKDLSAYVRTLTAKQRNVPSDTEAHQ
jgi:hypothetical protein